MATVPVVATPNPRVVRRRKGALVASATPRALTAASAPVTDPQQIFKTGMGGRRNDWQAEAWDMYRLVGEFAFYVRWRARSCSRVTLVASEIDPDTGRPTGSIAEDNKEGLRFAEIVKTIAGNQLGQSQLIKRTTEVLSVPGELWIAILMRPEGEKWFAVTRKQIEKGTRRDSVLIKLPDGSKHEFDKAAGDGMFRVWNPDPEDASQPDSPVQSCLDPLREIVRTTKKIRNADNSRMNNNGILFVPSEASLPPAQAPVSADKPGAPAPPPKRPIAPALQEMILQVQLEGSKDEGSAAALAPIVASAPGDQLKNINHVDFGKDITEVALKTRDNAIDRLAMGLDMSPEQLRGLGKTNHWSGRQLADEDVQLHVSPVLELICHAIYDNVLRNVLADEGIDPDKYVLWYDTSQLTVDPDKTDEAKDAHEKGALSSAGLLRAYGLPDDSGYDFSTIDGWKLWAQDKVSQDPKLLRGLLPLLDASVQGVDFPEPVALPAGSDDPDDDESGSKPGEEPDTEDKQAAALRASVGLGDVSMAMDLMVTRALELAGKRRVKTYDHDQRARLHSRPANEWHKSMPAAADREVPDLIKGWDVGLDALAARYGLDADEVRLVVQREARRQLTSQVVDA